MTQLTRILPVLTQMLPVVLAISLLASLVGVVSVAVFTSVATNPTNTFSAGTVVISTSPASAFITYSNMAPGDSVTSALTVTNGGTLELRYAMTTSADNTDLKALRDQLVLTIKTKTANPCSTFDGTQLYTGTLNSGFIGSPTPGFQAGDRTLAPTPANEVLCFRVQLPIGTGDTFQGATTTATFTFNAEQTVNNP
jgi:spore coat-associated protein N